MPLYHLLPPIVVVSRYVILYIRVLRVLYTLFINA